jgi:hypothetical protein
VCFRKGKRSARGAAPQEPRLQASSVGIGSVRKEQLLAIDLVVGNGLLAVRRHQPIDELPTETLLHVGVLGWVHQDDAVLVEQVLVALHKDFKIAPVPETDPGQVLRSERT